LFPTSAISTTIPFSLPTWSCLHSAAVDGARSDTAKADHIPQPRHASQDDALEPQERDGQRAGAKGRPDTTRRKSVVFEEDDELDVPDFLK